jgi:hypothetical protein
MGAALYSGWLLVSQWSQLQWMVKVYVEVTRGTSGPLIRIGCFDGRHTSCAWQIIIVYR